MRLPLAFLRLRLAKLYALRPGMATGLRNSKLQPRGAGRVHQIMLTDLCQIILKVTAPATTVSPETATEIPKKLASAAGFR